MTCSVTLSNRCRVDAVVLEVDEHYARIVCPKVRSDYIVITNGFGTPCSAMPIRVCGREAGTDQLSPCQADPQCRRAVLGLLLPENPRVYYAIARQET